MEGGREVSEKMESYSKTKKEMKATVPSTLFSSLLQTVSAVSALPLAPVSSSTLLTSTRKSRTWGRSRDRNGRREREGGRECSMMMMSMT